MKFVFHVHGRHRPMRPDEVNELRRDYPAILDFDDALRDACGKTAGKQFNAAHEALQCIRAAMAATERHDVEKRRQQELRAKAATEKSKPAPAPQARTEEPAQADAKPPCVESSVVPLRIASTNDRPPAAPKHAMLNLYRSATDPEHVMIQTSAADLGSYIPALARALADAVYADTGDTEQLLRVSLAAAIPLAIRLAGYKIDSVREERVLTAGFVLPEPTALIGSAEG